MQNKHTHTHTHKRCSVQFSSVTQSCTTLWDPMDCSMPGFPVHHQLLELAQTHVHLIDFAIQPSHPLFPVLLLPLIFSSIRVFSNQSVLPMRRPKYWSFNFSISLSNENSGLISFRIDGLDLEPTKKRCSMSRDKEEAEVRW